MAATAVLAAAAPALADEGGSGGDHHGGDHHGRDVLRAGLVGSKPGDAPLFGVQPGGKGWVIRRGEVRVRRGGRIRVRVRHLVFAPGEAGAGTNTVPRIAATLYCGAKAAGTTKAVPFSSHGNARIRDRLAKPPRPCADPTVLLNPADAAGTVNAAVFIAKTTGARHHDGGGEH